MCTTYLIQKLAPGIHLLRPKVGDENCYLVEGRDLAALVDSGRGLYDIREAVRLLTDRPIVVVNTHAHWDHIGGNHLFEQVGVHPSEAEALTHPQLSAGARHFLREIQRGGEPTLANVDLDGFHPVPSRATHRLEQGQVIDLGGGRQLQVWHTPGHSPGSLCFLEESERILFSGDTIMEAGIRLHLPGSDPQAMLQSLGWLSEMAWDINLVLPGHGRTPTDGRLILEISDGLRRTLDGEVRLKKGVSPFGALRIASFDRFMLFLPPDWKPAPDHTPSGKSRRDLKKPREI